MGRIDEGIPKSSLTFDGCRKRDFFFPDETRLDQYVAIGELASLPVIDDSGNLMKLEFKVTRSSRFELSCERWVYGALLYGDNGYAQVEIRLYERHPQRDTIEVFPSAPPI